MAPKRESSVKKSLSPVTQPRLGPPYPSLPAAPKPTPALKPRMLRSSDSPFDPSSLEVSTYFNDEANTVLGLQKLGLYFEISYYFMYCRTFSHRCEMSVCAVRSSQVDYLHSGSL